METYYVIIIILIILAVIDLIVGVSNDAVNFLNSAVGSKAASFRTILIVASIGILLGSGFSAGMMQVARSGIFNPGFFSFEQVMIIFAAVMITDVLLLDIFNSFGLPTSTTVSIVFELLGASFAISLIYLTRQDLPFSELANALNYSSALTIIFSIFLSVGLAFLFGSLFQFIFRLTFSFRLKKYTKLFGAPFSALAITVIVYFLLIEGAEGSALITPQILAWINNNTVTLVTVIFISGTILFFILIRLSINPLKIVVLSGTFSLAMAFAGNDLVNFIGPGVAAWVSFQSWIASSVPADQYNMQVLATDVPSPAWFLFAAGIIMAITLWTNAKSRKVTQTEVSLGRQDEGDERFTPNFISRSIVSGTLYMGKGIAWLLPDRWSKFIGERLRPLRKNRKRRKKTQSFDLLRASVNLLVASALIAYGTSNHLPLSTTFVTFMVAMGSSLADQAWGMDSAVYRVAGVLTVIGGWLITALTAFASSAVMAIFFYFTGLPGILTLFGVAMFLLIRSHLVFQKKASQEKAVKLPKEVNNTLQEFFKDSATYTRRQIRSIRLIYEGSINLLLESDRKSFGPLREKVIHIQNFQQKINPRILSLVRKLDEVNLPAGRFNLRLFDLTLDLTQSTELIFSAVKNHRDNMHLLPEPIFLAELEKLRNQMGSFLRSVNSFIKNPSENRLAIVKKKHDQAFQFIEELLNRQVISVQKHNVGNRTALLQSKLLLESQDILEEAFEVTKVLDLYFKVASPEMETEVQKNM